MVKPRKGLSAGHGINSWLQQRLTAVIMLISIIIFGGLILLAHNVVGSSIASWQEYFSFTIVKIIAQITILAVVLHAWIGMRDVVMDYVKCYGLRVTLYTGIILWLLGSTIYSFIVIWA
ncbi:MAG: succinate dehydrogenase, hydrophobic membrane anchor protein [Burkholderiales bacterium]|nr:succinate dehydrogenase, hydrophobic membrane anchor protein [Burkholderiales bacterium]